MATPALGQFSENLDLPQNLSTSRLDLPPPNFAISSLKDSKLAPFEPQISVKTETSVPQSQVKPPDQVTVPDNFDKFITRVKKYDPLLLWGVLRPKILKHVTLWDVLLDKTVIQAQTMPVGNVPSERLRIMLHEINELIQFVSEALDHCCESQVKIEGSNSNENASIPTIDDVLVPEKLMPALNIGKNSLKMKVNVDLTKYERLFAIDESLKPVSDFT